MKKCLCIFCALMFLWIGMPAYAQSIPEAENWKRMTDGTAIGLSAESYVTNTTPIPCTFTTDSFYASQLTAQLLIGSNGRVAIGLKRVQATIENELGVDKDFTLVLTDSSGTTQQLPGCMDSGSPWITFDKNASRKIIQALYRGDAFTFSLMGPLVSPLNSPSVYLFTMKNTAELESCLPPTNVTTLLNRLIAVEKSNLWHVMDPVGGIVIPGVYHTVVDDIALNGELALLANADEMILLNRAGEIVGSYDQIDIFDSLNTFGLSYLNVVEGLVAVWKDGKLGFINEMGEAVLPCEYSEADEPGFSEGLLCVCENDLLGYVNLAGEQVVPCIYEEASDFSCGMALVKKDGLYSTIDTQGKILHTFSLDEYCNIGTFSEGMIPVCLKTAEDFFYGYVNQTGKLTIPCQFDTAEPFHEGLAFVTVDDSELYGYIDLTGSLAFSLPEDMYWGGSFENGKASVSGMYTGYVDRTGEYVIPPRFDFYQDFSEGIAYVGVNCGEQFVEGKINEAGQLIIPYEYEGPGTLRKGLIYQPAAVYGEYVFVNETGEQITSYTLYRADFFSEGLSYACTSQGDGFIDKQGNMVIRCDDFWAEPFKNGFSVTYYSFSDNQYGLMDKYGNHLLPIEYDAIACTTSHVATIRDGVLSIEAVNTLY